MEKLHLNANHSKRRVNRLGRIFFFRIIFLSIFSTFIFTGCGLSLAEVDVLKGNYFYQKGEFQQSTVCYLKALEKNKGIELISYNMGNVFYALGEGDSALAIWKDAEFTTDVKILFKLNFNRGVLFYRQGNYKEAYKNFRRALEINPSDNGAKINLELTLEKISSMDNNNKRKLSALADTGEETVLGDNSLRMLQYVKRKEEFFWSNETKEEIAVDQDDW